MVAPGEVGGSAGISWNVLSNCGLALRIESVIWAASRAVPMTRGVIRISSSVLSTV